MHPYFTDNYHFIAPDQGGHGKAGAYISADEEYKTLKRFLVDAEYRESELVYGASLGVAIGYRIFLDPDFTVHHAFENVIPLLEKHYHLLIPALPGIHAESDAAGRLRAFGLLDVQGRKRVQKGVQRNPDRH